MLRLNVLISNSTKKLAQFNELIRRSSSSSCGSSTSSSSKVDFTKFKIIHVIFSSGANIAISETVRDRTDEEIAILTPLEKIIFGDLYTLLQNVYKVTRGNFSTLEEHHVAFFTALLGEKRVIMDLSDLEHYNVDWFRQFRGNSRMVLKPRTTEEMSEILAFCNENRLAVCPQGGNTSVSGGSVPVLDEIIVSTSLMDEIASFDATAGILVCQAGCVLEKLEQFLNEKGFAMPLDLGAKGSCQIGGNLSTNAGGKRLIRYGNLHGNVLGLEAVKANGEVIDCLSTLKKDNTGYHLKHLFIGSEGTLGIITKVAMQCPVNPKSVNLVLLGLQTFDKVLRTFERAKEQLSEVISAVEVIDAETMDVVISKLNLTNPIGDYPFYLIVETFGSNEEHDREKLSAFLDLALKKHLVLNGTLITDTKKYREVWALRERAPETFLMDCYTFTYDISLPLKDFYEITEEVRAHLASRVIKTTGFGHLGDGNLHLNVYAEKYSTELQDYINTYLYKRVRDLNGSISAEHGLGFLKAKYLEDIKDRNALKLMRDVKNLMDPNGILNPYKVIHKDY